MHPAVHVSDRWILVLAVGLLLTFGVAVAVVSKSFDPEGPSVTRQVSTGVIVRVPTESGLESATKFPQRNGPVSAQHSNGLATLDWNAWGGRAIALPYDYAVLFGGDDLPSGALVDLFCLQEATRSSVVRWLDNHLPAIATIADELDDRVQFKKLPPDGESALQSLDIKAVFIDSPVDSVNETYGFVISNGDVSFDLQLSIKAWGYGSSRAYALSVALSDVSKRENYRPNWDRE